MKCVLTCLLKFPAPPHTPVPKRTEAGSSSKDGPIIWDRWESRPVPSLELPPEGLVMVLRHESSLALGLVLATALCICNPQIWHMAWPSSEAIKLLPVFWMGWAMLCSQGAISLWALRSPASLMDCRCLHTQLLIWQLNASCPWRCLVCIYNVANGEKPRASRDQGPVPAQLLNTHDHFLGLPERS